MATEKVRYHYTAEHLSFRNGKRITSINRFPDEKSANEDVDNQESSAFHISEEDALEMIIPDEWERHENGNYDYVISTKELY